MSFMVDSIWVLNPKLYCTHASMPFNKVIHCQKFQPLLRTRFSGPDSGSGSKLALVSNAKPVPPNGVAAGFLPLNPRTSRNLLKVAFAALDEDSEHREIEVEKGKDEPIGSEESQEASKQVLDTFKEQALKIQGISQEAYELYSKKAIVILKDTAEQLKIQADKAVYDLSVAAKEISEESKDYLNTATENSPEVKEIVETFTSPTDNLKEISEVRDFYVGIPYGLILSLGGFLSFMVTGSVSGIRFGLILGGVLLALSISSLRSYKRGEPSPLALKGQAAIAGILFLREISLLGKGLSYFTALISGAVVAFYVYRMFLEGKRQKGSNLQGEAEN